MHEEKPDLNVYGHNQPDEKCVVKPGIREQGTAETLDQTREKHKVETGGMGREGTPKDGPSEGEWHHDDEAVVHSLDDHPELEETPMPPRNAPLSDEVPS